MASVRVVSKTGLPDAQTGSEFHQNPPLNVVVEFHDSIL